MAEDNKNSSISTSITDLMTSIAIIFILLLVVYLNHSFQEIHKGSASRREKVLKDLTLSNIKAQNDTKDPLAILFSVNGDELQFDSGKYNIKPKGQAYLKHFTPKLVNSICNHSAVNDIESVNIVGYTDSIDNDEQNLELSQGRALEVLKFSLNKTGLTPQKRECLLRLSSTNGRGERNLLPVGVKAGKENKNISRRVEFKIRVKSYEQMKQTELPGKDNG